MRTERNKADQEMALHLNARDYPPAIKITSTNTDNTTIHTLKKGFDPLEIRLTLESMNLNHTLMERLYETPPDDIQQTKTCPFNDGIQDKYVGFNNQPRVDKDKVGPDTYPSNKEPVPFIVGLYDRFLDPTKATFLLECNKILKQLSLFNEEHKPGIEQKPWIHCQMFNNTCDSMLIRCV